MKIGNTEIEEKKIVAYIKKLYVDDDENLICKSTYKIDDNGKIFYATVETKNKKEIGYLINYGDKVESGGTLKRDSVETLDK